MYSEHIINVGRRTRLRVVGQAEATGFTLPFSQEVMADVLGLSVPHLNHPAANDALGLSIRARCWRSPTTSHTNSRIFRRPSAHERCGRAVCGSITAMLVAPAAAKPAAATKPTV